MSPLPRPLSWVCDTPAPGSSFPGHSHDHDELFFVAGDSTTVLHAGADWPCSGGTLFLFRRGEVHGFSNRGKQQPRLWLIHFEADEALYRECPQLDSSDPAQRVWTPSAEQQSGFYALFTRMIAESMASHAKVHEEAMSAWMRLLLINVARWGDLDHHEPPGIDGEPEVAALWELIVQHVEASESEFRAALARQVRNYDSLRHRFKRIYGRAPSDFLFEARIERAKYLLLDTTLLVNDISQKLGYTRHSDFTRAFVRRTGLTPTAFRSNPRVVGHGPINARTRMVKPR